MFNGIISRKAIGMAIFSIVAIYWAHRALRMQYFRHCHRDLVRVIMFDQSAICVNVANILSVLEVSCNQVVRHATTYMLGTLGTLTAALVTAVASNSIRRRPGSEKSNVLSR
jgi:hypothetical protein